MAAHVCVVKRQRSHVCVRAVPVCVYVDIVYVSFSGAMHNSASVQRVNLQICQYSDGSTTTIDDLVDGPQIDVGQSILHSRNISVRAK